MFSIPESKRAKSMITVSIVNVTSYTGLELLRLLAQHPHFILKSATARSAVGKRLDEVFPQLRVLRTNDTPVLHENAGEAKPEHSRSDPLRSPWVGRRTPTLLLTQAPAP